MSASIPVPTSNTGSYEPSMEEILASIRRIIADDQSIPRAVAAEALSRKEPDTDPAPAPVHRLYAEQAPTVAAESPAPEATAPELIAVEPAAPDIAASERPGAREAAPDAMVSQGTIAAPQYPMPDAPTASVPLPSGEVDPHPAELPAPKLAERAEPRRPSPAANSLFSADTNKSVASAFNALAVSRLADNSEELMGIARDMIRPLLRSWMDDNLPTMVERMVRDEIERVARGGP